MNLSCFVLSILQSPGFRPRWKHYNWFTALSGFALCLAIMLVVSWRVSSALSRHASRAESAPRSWGRGREEFLVHACRYSSWTTIFGVSILLKTKSHVVSSCNARRCLSVRRSCRPFYRQRCRYTRVVKGWERFLDGPAVVFFFAALPELQYVLGGAVTGAVVSLHCLDGGAPCEELLAERR